jgi:hypothetical protein
MYAPVSVIQSRPDGGAASVQFTNLLSRLLEQVPSPSMGVQLATEYMYSLFYLASTVPSYFCIHWGPQHGPLTSPLPFSLLLHRRLPSLLNIRQSFHRLTRPHQLNR